ncbi:MAG: hypothetical protein EOO77_35640 [Oxalobacteraceae bacterium]|nr:MAG: hypothetical protein EOO77_35640 [Oxalobacteraceae bacterium]
MTDFVWVRREFVKAKTITLGGQGLSEVKYDLHNDAYDWLEDRFTPDKYKVYPHGTRICVSFQDSAAAFEFKVRWG